MEQNNFWNDELRKEFCDLLDVNSNIHPTVLLSDFKASKTKPKEYEILECTSHYMGEENVLFKLNSLGDYVAVTCKLFTNDVLPIDKIIGSNSFQIKSVRRLSDNLLVSIGTNTDEGKVTGFYIKNDTLYISIEGISALEIWQIKIDNEKVPLFTTTDGKDIYEGDEYWFVYPQFVIGKKCRANSEMNGCLGTFSTKEAAAKYVLWNSSKFSLTEIMANSADMGHDHRSLNINDLIELAKSKTKTNE